MFSKRLISFTLSVAALVTPVFAGRMDEKVRNDFFSGFAGDRAALDRAMLSAEQAIAAAPDTSAEALAWHGGALLFLSGMKFQQGDMPGGMEMWSKGSAEMEAAGALEPDNPAVLIPRASVWLAASRNAPPEMAKPILTKGLADYEHVLELQKNYFNTLGVHPRSELLFGLADGYSRAGNTEKAHLYFEKLAAIGAASGHQDQAAKYLNGEKYTVRGVGCAGCHIAK